MKQLGSKIKSLFSRIPGPRIPLLLVVVLLLIAGGVLTWAYLHSKVVLRVDGKAITRTDLFDTMYAIVGKEAVQELTDETLILREGCRLGLEVNEEDIDAEIDLVINSYFAGDREYFSLWLEEESYSEEALRRNIRKELMLEELARLQDYSFPEEVETRHILLETEEDALSVMLLLEQGDDFSGLAEQLSLCPSAVDGGYLGFLRRGYTYPEFENAIFDELNVEEPEGPVLTPAGYHVIEVLSRSEAETMSFEEVERNRAPVEVEEILHELKQQLLADLRQQAVIRRY